MVSPISINMLLLILICLLLRFSIGHSLQVKYRTVGTDLRLQVERLSVKVDNGEEWVAAEMEERTRFGGRKMGSSEAMRSQRVGEASSTSSGAGQGCVKNKIRSGHNSVRVNMSGFVSWNADYNVPRPHPPRNN